jgi:hypothetical protein
MGRAILNSELEKSGTNGDSHPLAGNLKLVDGQPPLQEFERLETENSDLLQQVANLEQAVAEATKKAQLAADLQQDLERLLEEKSDVIRELHAKIQELQDQAPVKTPSDQELLALEEELEQERRQLKEDEQSLMQQMRDMEVQMSRERAELARQRNEMQRLHSEIRHELELASREAELRERLQPLQRRYQEMSHRKGAEPARDLAAQAPTNQPAQESESQRPRESGLFRRLFG